MTDPEKLAELAERCEKASGPDRELDVAIAAALHVKQLTYQSTEWIKDPEFTASLDAAMSLVPEGCGWRLWAPAKDSAQSHRATIWAARGMPVFSPFDCEAATPALALCAAALRSRLKVGG